jgi:Arc/MetJ family transcription regulator
MRTNIDIDDELMREAMKATGTTTKRAAVEKALRKLVALKTHEKEVKKVFRKQEVERQKAEREGRLDEWHAELVKKGNWPEYPDDAD